MTLELMPLNGVITSNGKVWCERSFVTYLKRGSAPLGGGEVHLLCSSLIPQPLTIHALDIPKFSAIRGVAYCTRVSPSIVNRMIDSARAVLKPTGCEVNITADVWRRKFRKITRGLASP